MDLSAVTVEDPVLVIEVLSTSTEATDRREKLLAYRTIASLSEYVLVSQDEARIEIHRRPRRHRLGEDRVLRAGDCRARVGRSEDGDARDLRRCADRFADERARPNLGQETSPQLVHFARTHALALRGEA